MGAALTAAAPLIPDGDEARDWAERELADPAYTIAEPTPLDRFSHAVVEFLNELFNGRVPGSWGPWVAVGATVVIVAVVVVAIAVWGVPRSSARTRTAADLFGAPEQRSAAQLRTAAAQHASRQEWDAAIAERFRALARGLDERSIVDAPPGATVHAFARDAATAFPAFAGELERAAAAFDDVRYLRRPGTAELYRTVADVDDSLATATASPHRPDLAAAAS